jgi:hypothetical protein
MPAVSCGFPWVQAMGDPAAAEQGPEAFVASVHADVPA